MPSNKMQKEKPRRNSVWVVEVWVSYWEPLMDCIFAKKSDADRQKKSFGLFRRKRFRVARYQVVR